MNNHFEQILEMHNANKLVETSEQLDDIVSNQKALTQEDWIPPTLTNSWINFGGAEATAGYFKDQFGVVHLKGTIKSGTLDAAAFTLPAGYRPAALTYYATNSNGAFGALNIYSNGEVRPKSGSSVFFSLAGITFKAVQ